MKALALFSGGLDSILAVKLIQEQGIEVIGICFESPFFSAQKACQSAQEIGLPLKIIDITDRLIPIVRSPRHGHGRGLNPCIDCHALMVRVAGEMIEGEGAGFIISGEVVGQRPMSQNVQSLSIVSRESGFEDLILRPLSAKRLPETLAERKGWVDREGLLGLSGRSRKPQMELAKKYGVGKYPSPAGGCLLTERVFSRRLGDLVSEDQRFSIRDIELLKWGRHFRISETVKVVVGRNQKENERIASLVEKGDTVFTVASFPGPFVLAIGDLSPGEPEIVAAITVSYSDSPGNQPVSVKIERDATSTTLFATAEEKNHIHRFMI
jgi:tRNA-specific 2-thiouridylase